MPARVTASIDELAGLHEHCRAGRLYEIERWIERGHPLQLEDGVVVRGRRRPSALETALERGDHSMALVLLCNGYDPDREPYSPLDQVLEARRWDLLDLLLEWGADPRQVSPGQVFGTYQTEIFERFRALGVDLTAYNELAEVLANLLGSGEDRMHGRGALELSAPDGAGVGAAT